MFEVVAAIHKQALEIAKRLDDPHAFARRNQQGVLPSAGDETVSHGRIAIRVVVVETAA